MNIPLNKIFRKLSPYVPGEQPSEKNFIKLNTNENPFPVPKEVINAIREQIDGSIRKYPDPEAYGLRKAIGKHYGFDPGWIFAGNGSDEILRLCITAFSSKDDYVAFLHPSYPLYEVLATISDRKPCRVNLKSDFNIPDDFMNRYNLYMKIIANPDSPSGCFHPVDQIRDIAKKLRRVLVIDEAYADFSKDNCLNLVKDFENVIVVRTFSKSFSLAGMRIGYCFGNPRLISALLKIKDSYNLNTISQVAGISAINHYDVMMENCRKIIRNRDYLKGELEKIGFYVFPSSANFILVKPLHIKAEDLYKVLKEKRILVRYFGTPLLKDYLRITIGSKKEIKVLMSAIKEII
ncbi:MAG TPA: histidinol-phosphate transaminase [bacterium]|jgi:histidinol-phosphate aminotransferase|nr:histidinol-phosphate transaminase [bacterium]